MKKIIAHFIKYPIYSNAIILITALVGIISLSQMPRSFFPELSPNKIYINVAYPGASPEEIEQGITTRVEESLNGIEGIEEITSSSSENISQITVKTYAGFNIDEILQEIKNSVDAIYSFPEGAEKPTIQKQKSRGMGGMGNTVGFYALNGPDDLWSLKEKSDQIEKDLLSDDNISQLEVIGYSPIIISVELNENELLRHNLNFDIVSNKIKMSNIDISGGSIKTKKDEIIIRSNNRKNTAEELRKIVIQSNINGGIVRLKDVASVEMKFSEIPIKSYVNGERSISFIIKKTPDEDLKKIANSLENYINKFNSENKDFEILTLFQFSDMLDQRIETLSDNLILGLILVLIVLGFFLSFRLSAWVAFGIPFSFIGMISIGILYGMTINMISLFGMILVVGILVDDGIVIAENIYSHFERGKSPMQAALDGTMEVVTPVLTSVLTTVFAFSTLLFVGGEMEMMEEMAFSVIAALLFSLIEAFLILPSHLSNKKVFTKEKNTIFSKIKENVENFIIKLRDKYNILNKKFIKNYRYHVWTPIIFISLVLILLINGTIRWTFFPSVPFNEVKIEFAYKPGEREFRTENFLIYCDSIIQDYNKELIEKFNDSIITNVSYSIGFTENLGVSGANVGSIRISSKENDLISTIQMTNDLQSRISKDSISQMEKITFGGAQQFGKEVSISLQSENDLELKESVEWLKDKISNINIVKEVLDNGGVGNRELHLKLKEKAYSLGLTEIDIYKQIRQGFFGEEVQRLIIGRDEVKIWVQYTEKDRNSIQDLENIKIKTKFGQQINLSELVEYEYKRGRVKINHIDGTKEIRVDASLFDAEYSGVVNDQIEKDYLQNLSLFFPNVKYKIMGQAERAADSGKRLGIAFLISIILIVITISLNFKSFYQARLILMVIPVGVFSAILGHGIMGKPFSTLSVWGVIALIGILVNDAVVMLDRFNRNLEEGMDIKKAVLAAGNSRFRPIILTTITTFVGLFPLILETSFQSQFLIPMAISVAFGVLFGTILLLFYFPSLILYFNDIRRSRWWLWRGGKTPPSRMEVEPFTKLQKRNLEIEN
ncbi:MAG: acriflavin resistance protein [Flavobacteriales bacterium]|nr:acriflavin resistance protein [Flavobacteriales bacterium]